MNKNLKYDNSIGIHIHMLPDHFLPVSLTAPILFAYYLPHFAW